jgi:hypothetical protein
MKSTHHVVSGPLAYHVNHRTAPVLLDLHVLYLFIHQISILQIVILNFLRICFTVKRFQTINNFEIISRRI